jgi:hypothetical protein
MTAVDESFASSFARAGVISMARLRNRYFMMIRVKRILNSMPHYFIICKISAIG